jgi:hypothetical protein
MLTVLRLIIQVFSSGYTRGADTKNRRLEASYGLQALGAWTKRGERCRPEPIALIGHDGFCMGRSPGDRLLYQLFDAAANPDRAFWVEKGVLASYGPDFYDTGRQAARLVEKILKGTKPAEIPVEVNEKIEFVINLKTAHALGLTIAPAVLFQAHRLIR